MTTTWIRYALGLVLAWLLAAPANASPITVTLSGSVVGVEPFYHPTLSLGDTISGSLTYEGDVSGSGSVAGPPYGASFSFGPTSHAGATVEWYVSPPVGDPGCFTGNPCVALGISTPLGGGLDHETWLFFDFPSGIPSPDPWPETEFALPDAAALATAPTIYIFDLNVGGAVDSIRLIAEVTSISFVPEPGGLTLLAGVLLALGARRRRCV